MNKNTIINKIDELNNYLDVLEDLLENDNSVIYLFAQDLSSNGFSLSSCQLEYTKNLVDKGLIVQYEEAYYRPWQLKIYCEDYPSSQQFQCDCEEFDYTEDEKESYANDHEAKIQECEKSQDNIILEIHKTQKEIELLTDKLELMS